MKLPDFTGEVSLNKLRDRMGAELVAHAPTSEEALSFVELEQLSSGELEISLKQIKIRYDGIFTYKGRAVLVYIPERDKKFHVTDCETIRHMKAIGRWDKYIASERTDGVFKVRSESGVMCSANLAVCMNCLKQIKWNGKDGFRRGDSLSQRYVAQFSIKKFFNKYGSGKISQMPKYSALTMPINQYVDNWDSISQQFREKKGYVCEQCGFKAQNAEQRAWLHTHHRNGGNAREKVHP